MNYFIKIKKAFKNVQNEILDLFLVPFWNR
jgi:hypothetical protein